MAYIGIGSGLDQTADEELVKDLGAKLSLQEAKGFFPELDEKRYGKLRTDESFKE